jgi:general secretion pathway protein A
VLIIDEAHRLTADHIEEIRLLTNFGSLQIVLAGQVELSDIMNQHNMRQAKQRVSVIAFLNPLDAGETRDYIGYRWTKAGGGDLPFTRGAIDRIAEISRGIPRLINLLCDRSLLAAFATEQTSIEAGTVREIAAELRLDSGDSEPAYFRENSRIRLDSLEHIGKENNSVEVTPEATLPEAIGQRPWFRWPRTT